MKELAVIAHQIHFNKLWNELDDTTTIDAEMDKLGQSRADRDRWCELFECRKNLPRHVTVNGSRVYWITSADVWEDDYGLKVYIVSDAYDYSGNWDGDDGFGENYNRGHRRYYEYVPCNFLKTVSKMPVDFSAPTRTEFTLDTTDLRDVGLFATLESSENDCTWTYSSYDAEDDDDASDEE